MSGESVTTTWHERVCVLTLNRPEKRNAMDDDVTVDFRDAVQALRGDSRARAVVLTGAGDAFSAGGNLQRMLERTVTDVAANRKEILAFYETYLAIRQLEVPVIAAVNGPAIGAGACLCMACDMRYAADTARIGFTFVRIGLHPGMGAEWFLTRAVGEAKAYELLMTGDILTAAEAERIGLVNRVVPAGELMEKTLELARKIAAQPSFPIKMLKQTVPAATRGELCDILRLEATYQAMCYSGGDLREGITAMIEKRPPRFADDA